MEYASLCLSAEEWFIHGVPVRKLSLCPLPPSDVSQKTHVNHVKAHVNEDLPKRLPKRGGMVFCLLVYVRKELTCLSLFTVSEICV